MKAVDEWTTLEEAEILWKATLKLAIQGNFPATKLVMSYLFGAPPQSIELSGAVTTAVAHKGLRNLSDEELADLERLAGKLTDEGAAPSREG